MWPRSKGKTEYQKEMSMWAGFQSGKFSAYRQDRIVITFRKGTQRQGSFQWSQCSQRAFSIQRLLQPFPPQPGGPAAQVAAMTPVTGVGGRTEAQGESEVLGLHLNFPATSPVSSLAPSLSIYHTLLYSGCAPMAKLVFSHLVLVET